jgi:hypothetical protein
MGFLDSLQCCASRPGRSSRGRQHPRAGLAAGDAEAPPPAVVWESIAEVGELAKQVQITAIHTGVRYYSEDGRHLVMDSEGNLALSRPSDHEGTVVSHFDQWLAGQTAAAKRQQEPHLDLGASAVVAGRLRSKALRVYTIPDLVHGEEAGLLDRRTLHALWQKVPPLSQAQDWVLVYGMRQHGAALSTLLHRTAGIDTTLLVVKTTGGELFGGFATSVWATKVETALGSATFFGRGDTWLYRRFPNSGSAEAAKFTWSREDQHFRELQQSCHPRWVVAQNV